MARRRTRSRWCERRVARDLAAIVDRAMARKSDARYRTARELAEDLKAFQTGQLVASHRYTAGELGDDGSPAATASCSAIAGVALAALAAIGTLSIVKILQERDLARDAQAQTDRALGDVEHQRHELVKLQARSALPGDPTATIAWLGGTDGWRRPAKPPSIPPSSTPTATWSIARARSASPATCCAPTRSSPTRG